MMQVPTQLTNKSYRKYYFLFVHQQTYWPGMRLVVIAKMTTITMERVFQITQVSLNFFFLIKEILLHDKVKPASHSSAEISH